MLIHHKPRSFSNFSRAIHTRAMVARPDNERQLHTITAANHPNGLLARGNGLSYSDCCVLNKGIVIDTSRLNHILSFDPLSGIAVCQGGVTFASLFLLDPQFIPPVLPGTLHATIAGGIANDVHGKNNHHTGSIGEHIEWLELDIGGQLHHCSRTENHDLFIASIAGLGLTGIITRVAIRLRKASHFVTKQTEKFTCMSHLLDHMQHEGIHHDYQVAWLDFLNKPRALLSVASHSESPNTTSPIKSHYTVPKLPIRLINAWLMKRFNQMYFLRSNTRPQTLPLWTYNNPLDGINHWNRLYGKQGLLQFQAVFDATKAALVLKQIALLIKSNRATATLAVLKYFNQSGIGLLSFAQPGFTIAIDLIHNQHAREAIDQMNQFITEIGGKIYLAKDLRLNHAQFDTMYPRHREFYEVINKYNSPMRSDLGIRLSVCR